MRAIISFIISTMMLNLSVHAGAARKNTTTAENDQVLDKDLESEEFQSWEKQKMEDATDSTRKKKKYYRGFEYNPRPHSPDSTPEERIQTKD